LIHVRNKDFEIEVEVTGLSNIRRGAPEASLLFAETEISKQKREHAKITREVDHAVRERGTGRPTKRQLRDIKKFTGMT
jgi:ribosome-associated heat shock protein Hsp15